jgi:hypothetical protein
MKLIVPVCSTVCPDVRATPPRRVPRRQHRLAARGQRHHPAVMFVVTEADAAAIRTACDQGGEFAAAVELRRLFPGVTDNTQARECARTIAGWKPLPVKPVRRLRPRGCRSGV